MSRFLKFSVSSIPANATRYHGPPRATSEDLHVLLTVSLCRILPDRMRRRNPEKLLHYTLCFIRISCDYDPTRGPSVYCSRVYCHILVKTRRRVIRCSKSSLHVRRDEPLFMSGAFLYSVIGFCLILSGVSIRPNSWTLSSLPRDFGVVLVL